MNADQRLEQLFRSLHNYERSRVLPEDWSLSTIEELLDGADLGPPPGRFVQVAGSKGKGTTVAYLESMACAAGLRTGAFVSPHLQHVTERVRVDGEPVAATVLVDAIEDVLAIAAARGLDPSFFEAITLAAVLVFHAEAVDFVALEVGLGGRLDATTAVPVDATIVTKIELEHTDILGDTLTAIASEKAHTMRPGKPVWALPDPAVDEVLREHAARVGAQWLPVLPIVDVSDDADSLDGELRFGGDGLRVRVEGGSRFEWPAVALAYTCLRNLFPTSQFELDPVARPLLPGRFEVFEGDWPLVLDGAHTRASSAVVAAELCRRFGQQPVAVLFASASDKRWQEGLSAFLPLADRFFVTALDGTTGVAPAVVTAWLRQQGKIATEVAGPAEGLAALLRCEAVRLVVGSFYLVGAVRAGIEQAHE